MTREELLKQLKEAEEDLRKEMNDRSWHIEGDDSEEAQYYEQLRYQAHMKRVQEKKKRVAEIKRQLAGL